MSITASSLSFTIENRPKSEWDDIVDQFSDSNLYQTWAFGHSRWGSENLEHAVLSEDGTPIAAAQLRIIKIPFCKRGIAYIRWGPMWQPKNATCSQEQRDHFAKELREQYIDRRKMMLRILPATTKESDEERSVLESFKGFKTEPFPIGASYRTILINLTPPIATLRSNLNKKWRNQLNRAEKNRLRLTKSSSFSDLKIFETMYNELLERKGLGDPSNFPSFVEMQKHLPEASKLKITLCFKDDEAIAGAVTTDIGHTGIYLLGATSDSGLPMKGSYLVQWSVIEDLNANGTSHYNLGGINPETNPGVYVFKKRMGGQDSLYTPPISRCDSQVTESFIRIALFTQNALRRLKNRK